MEETRYFPSPPSFSSRDDVAGFIATGVKPILPAKARITRRNTRQILQPNREDVAFGKVFASRAKGIARESRGGN